ncbi:MAG: sigma-54 dependent transcriptional regulator [Planctomycetes bacterium]|nr:sigma-54 dependent transcriptional regulator [Planctomycetota bacterium]
MQVPNAALRTAGTAAITIQNRFDYNPMNKHVLIVDDNERLFDSLAINLRKNKLDAHWAGKGDDALRLMAERQFSAILLDLALGEEKGIDLLPKLLRASPGTPVIIITGYGTFEVAVRAIKLGAYDFLPKPLDIDRLLTILWNAIETAPSARDDPARTADMVANSPAMRELCEKARLVAKSDLPVLITGESGVGKELMAQYVHNHSLRRDKCFININCSAIAESLADSELFGHVKGAYTGASRNRAGYFERADGGTLHMDEIGDMSPAIQAKLLRVLEDSRIGRVGGEEEIAVDVRLIASTNMDLETAIEEGRFRKDLFYRLNAAHLHLPPLRERKEDIPALIETLLRRAGEPGRQKRFSSKAEDMLCAYDWPGNIRELKNLVQICTLLAPGAVIEPKDIPTSVAMRKDTQSVRLVDNERELIRKALAEAGGNRLLAAQKLGISRRTLYNKLERYDLS